MVLEMEPVDVHDLNVIFSINHNERKPGHLLPNSLIVLISVKYVPPKFGSLILAAKVFIEICIRYKIICRQILLILDKYQFHLINTFIYLYVVYLCNFTVFLRVQLHLE